MAFYACNTSEPAEIMRVIASMRRISLPRRAIRWPLEYSQEGGSGFFDSIPREIKALVEHNGAKSLPQIMRVIR